MACEKERSVKLGRIRALAATQNDTPRDGGELEFEMPGKVFVSCGQADPAERGAAADVKYWLESQGFDVFVALEVQSLNDINAGTIGHLRRADYYVFIDFPRDTFSARRKAI